MGNLLVVREVEHVRISLGADAAVMAGRGRRRGGDLAGLMARGVDEQGNSKAVVGRRGTVTLGNGVVTSGSGTTLQDSSQVGVIGSRLVAAE